MKRGSRALRWYSLAFIVIVSCTDNSTLQNGCVTDADCKGTRICVARQCMDPPDVGPLDAGPVDAGPIDAGPIDAGPIDAGPIDAGSIDAGPIDAGSPPVCTDGTRQRCWVECAQTYSSGCIHADLPPRIMGVESCSGGQWGDCTTLSFCSSFGPGSCTQGTNPPDLYECLDGTNRLGEMLCSRPLGANCMDSYDTGWGITDCVASQSQICPDVFGNCTTEGATQPCEVHCNTGTGPSTPGTQTCQAADCGGTLGHTLYWSQCFTMDACAN